jgi:hypothetical protein
VGCTEQGNGPVFYKMEGSFRLYEGQLASEKELCRNMLVI